MGDSGWHDTLDVDSSSRQILMHHILNLHLLLDCRPSAGTRPPCTRTAGIQAHALDLPPRSNSSGCTFAFDEEAKEDDEDEDDKIVEV